MTIQPADSPLADRRNRALGTGAPLFYREPLHLVRGDEVIESWPVDLRGW